ncbi:hypothetical protein BaRGS_00030791, partial [Batillaria attramentaria]
MASGQLGGGRWGKYETQCKLIHLVLQLYMYFEYTQTFTAYEENKQTSGTSECHPKSNGSGSVTGGGECERRCTHEPGTRRMMTCQNVLRQRACKLRYYTSHALWLGATRWYSFRKVFGIWVSEPLNTASSSV